MPGSCNLARARLARRVAELREPGRLEKATTAIKAGYVGSIVTPMRAIVGNATWGGMRHLVLQPTESAIDYLLSVGKSAKTGWKVKPHEFREVANGLTRDGVSAMWSGFKKGTAPTTEAFGEAKRAGGPIPQRISRFVSELSIRLEADHVARVLDIDRVKYKSPVAQALVDGAFGVLEAADRPFWKLALDGSLYMQGKLMAIREGLTGKAARARAAHYFENPTDEMMIRATDDANYATFKDRNILSRTAMSVKRTLSTAAEKKPDPNASAYTQARQRAIQRGAKVASFVTETNVPFTGVPSSVAAKIGAVSPLGFLSPSLLGGQAERARVLAQAGVGTAVMAVGFALAKKGQVTGAIPSSAAERAQWDEEGKQPYSVRVGNDWIGLASLGPVASSLFMGAKLAEIQDKEPDAGVTEQAVRTAFSGAQYLTQQTYLRNVGALIEAAQDDRKATALLASQIPLPAFGGQLNRAIDPMRRDTRDMKDRILARIPGGSFFTPEKVGAGGDTFRKSTAERIASVVSPLPVRRATDTPLLTEMRRLDVRFGLPARSITIDGEREAIDPDAYREFVREAGSAARTALENLITSERYLAADDERKAKAIEKVIASARDNARRPLKRELAAASMSDPVEAEARRAGVRLPDDPAVRAAVAQLIESRQYQDTQALAAELVKNDPKYRQRAKKSLALELKRGQIENVIQTANR